MMDSITQRFPLGAPDEDRPPMKNNAFEAARTSNSKLTPMFSAYLDKGCMVPAVACFTGQPGRSFQMFKHENSVDEVATVFGAGGAPLPVGALMVGARDHFVNVPFEDNQSPTNYAVLTVTQRQWEKDEPQWEKLGLVCEQCQEPLIEHSYVCDPPKDVLKQLVKRHDHIPFATLLEGVVAVDKLNKNPALLVCKECGFENKPFPLDDWGWGNYAECVQTVTQARADYPALNIENEGALES